MNTIKFAVFVIVLIFIQEHYCGVGDDIANFFKSIPREMKILGRKTKNAFESAWRAIKRPFTIRRMGRGGRRGRRTTASTTTTTTTESFSTDPAPVHHLFRRVPIPLIPSPEWRDLQQWNQEQLPQYALTEGNGYEFRRRQISKWANKYIGSLPTRTSTAATMPPASSKNTINTVLKPVRRAWLPILETPVYIKDGQVYRPIDYFELVWN